MYAKNFRRRMKNRQEEYLKKIMAKNFSNLKKDRDLHIEETNWITKRINADSTPRHIFEFSKAKDKVKRCKAPREKQCTVCKGSIVRLRAKFSSQSMEARSLWDDMFKVLKEHSTKNSLSRKTILQKWRRN